MANNYYDATGVLILDRVTPVITALFGALKMNETYPGDGEVYIAKNSESNDPQWDDVLNRLTVLAAALGRPLPTDREVTIVSTLRTLGMHFHGEDREDLEQLIQQHHPFDESASLEALFAIATCFDDGHGLKAIKLEGAWYCDKLRLFEFGGEGVFISREVVLYGSSSRALDLGSALRDALLSGSLDEVTARLALEVAHVLSGINDDATRQALCRKLAGSLLDGVDTSRSDSTANRL